MAVLSVGFPRVAGVFAAVWLSALPAASAGGHSCETEIASACPDSPASELAACLQDSSVHEQETTISSECTDFVAVNSACKEDVEKLCDDAFFSDDTLPCLTQWVQPEDLTAKCRGVLAWAAPAPEEEDEEGPTDELGMSEKDKQEKKEWMEKRRAGRGDAIERMKMQEVDKKKEEDRVALLKFKEENPEEYAEMIKQQEEEEKAVAAQKRKERQMQAAYLLQKQDAEKARRRAAGEDVDEDRPKNKAPKASKAPKAKEGTSAMTALFCVFFLLAVCAGGLYVAKTVTADADDLVSNTKQDKRERKENKENKKKNKRS